MYVGRIQIGIEHLLPRVLILPPGALAPLVMCRLSLAWGTIRDRNYWGRRQNIYVSGSLRLGRRYR